ncbi:MAG: hypothetical protein QXR30_00945 [Candidatus Woesearchaeota archaeon]
MKHKIIQIANNTLALCLPKEFIKKLSLKKGDVLSVCLYNDKLVMKKEQHIIKIDKSLWDCLSNYERIKLLKFLNKLGFEYIEIPSTFEELKNLNDIKITKLSDYSYILEFSERNELNEFKKIHTLIEILFDNIEKNEKEIIFKIKQKLQSINHQNLLKNMNYNLEKYLILLKILDTVNYIIDMYETIIEKGKKLSEYNIKTIISNFKKIIDCETMEEIMLLLLENKKIIKETITSCKDNELINHYLKLDIIS